MNGHRFQSIKVQQVAVVPHPSSDEPIMIYLGEAEEAIGCVLCNLNIEDAVTGACEGKSERIDIVPSPLTE